jgi:NADH-quinone oxidoreductase subunit N
MNFVMPIFSIATPEIFVVCMALIALLTDVFLPANRRLITYIIVQATVVLTLALSIWQFNHYPNSIVTFSGNYILDKLSMLLKMFISITCFFVFAYSREYITARKIAFGEFYVLGLLAVLGMLIMCSAYSLLTIYLGLELLSLALYAMVAMQRDSAEATEAAMKYFVMGALASGLLLYGISMVYGATGAIEILEIASRSGLTTGQHMVEVFGLIFIVVGLMFKFGAVPFHMWVPDVYQGAPTNMTLFIASAPKIAAFGITIRILVEAMPALHAEWSQILIVVAFLSMFFGNVLAIAQTNIKRMLAYSSIAHIGYMLLGIIAGSNSAEGYSAAIFYIATYTIAATGAFAIIALLSKHGREFDQLSDYKGLNSRNPWLAFLMLLLMFSMAGIPPTIGFFAKLGLLEALVEAHLVWLAASALLFAIIGAYYYLRVIMLMYFEEPVEGLDEARFTMSPNMLAVSTVNSLFVLVFGLFPSSIIDLCRVSFA